MWLLSLAADPVDTPSSPGQLAEINHGPMFIGFIFNATLLGLLSAQVWSYARRYRDDSRWVKIFVAVLYIANIANSVFDAMFLYNSVIIHFGDVEYIRNGNWMFTADPAATCVIAAMVQFFYVWRLTKLTKQYVVIGAVVLTTIAGLVGGLGTAVNCYMYPLFDDLQKFRAWPAVWLMCECVADVLITAVLVSYLERHKTGYRPTDELVDKVIRLALPTGAFTAVVAFVDIVLFLSNQAGLHLIFNFALAKLYSVSLMSSLNSRTRDAAKRSTEVPVSRSSRSSRGNQLPTVGSEFLALGSPRSGKFSAYTEDHERDLGSFGIQVTVDTIKSFDAPGPDDVESRGSRDGR